RMKNQVPPGLDLGRHVRELEGNALKLRDRTTELLSLTRVADGFLVRSLCDSQRERCDSYAPGIEGLHEVHEALSFLTQPILYRNLDVLEDQLARVGSPPAQLVLLLARAESRHGLKAVVVPHAELTRALEVRGFLGENEGGDAGSTRARVGHCGDDEDLAHSAVRYEDLAAVEHITITAPLRRGSGTGGVRAG